MRLGHLHSIGEMELKTRDNIRINVAPQGRRYLELMMLNGKEMSVVIERWLARILVVTGVLTD